MDEIKIKYSQEIKKGWCSYGFWNEGCNKRSKGGGEWKPYAGSSGELQ